jgi:hypothetical protein
MNLQDIKELALHSLRGTTPDPTKYSNQDVNEALRAEIKELAGTYNAYRRNKLDVFEIIQETNDMILPKYVEEFMGTFAEIKTVGHNQKAQFVRRRGRRRAKQFITEVGLSGVYEAFRLDKETFEVSAHAIGGAAYIDFERFLSGDEDLAEPMSLILEGIQEAVMGEVQKALLATINQVDRPSANIVVSPDFDPDSMARLCAVCRAYGGSATIFAPPEFIAAMGPDAIGLPIWKNDTGGATPVYAPEDISAIHNTGYIQQFRGNPIIMIPQSFTDETNTTTQINPGVAYVFPTGNEKIVKIVFEGETIVKDWENRDNSMEIQAYKKMGCAILSTHDWCVYQNTTLTNEADTKYEVPTK